MADEEQAETAAAEDTLPVDTEQSAAEEQEHDLQQEEQKVQEEQDETGSPEGDAQPPQPDSTEAEVVIPTVTDEEPELVATEEEEEKGEGGEEAALPTDEGELDVADDTKVLDQPSDAEDEDMGDEDLPQPEYLPDEPSDVVPYPSEDAIDIADEAPTKPVSFEAVLDELAELDEEDKPDPTRATERVGPVQECPYVPLPPPLLLEGRDDIETPTDESTIPSVLVCFSESYFETFLMCSSKSTNNVIRELRKNKFEDPYQHLNLQSLLFNFHGVFVHMFNIENVRYNFISSTVTLLLTLIVKLRFMLSVKLPMPKNIIAT